MKDITIVHRDQYGTKTGTTTIPAEAVEMVAEVLITAAMLVGRRLPRDANADEISVAMNEAENVAETLADVWASRREE